MAVFSVDVPDKLKEEFDALSDSLRLPKKEILVISIMFFLYLSQSGALNHIQSLALAQKKPFGDMILEVLKKKYV